jgi:DNA mismatch endonuclease (patch repair protein)
VGGLKSKRDETIEREKRSALMRRIRQKDTAPELVVRRKLHALGYRYTLHSASLPGRPDLAFPARRAALFVHGCFWHTHNCKHGRVRPATNTPYWDAKSAANRVRDRKKSRQLRGLGWRSMIVWECQTKDNRWVDRVRRFLDRG